MTCLFGRTGYKFINKSFLLYRIKYPFGDVEYDFMNNVDIVVVAAAAVVIGVVIVVAIIIYSRIVGVVDSYTSTTRLVLLGVSAGKSGRE
jgi:hypothetical protein